MRISKMCNISLNCESLLHCNRENTIVCRIAAPIAATVKGDLTSLQPFSAKQVYGLHLYQQFWWQNWGVQQQVELSPRQCTYPQALELCQLTYSSHSIGPSMTEWSMHLHKLYIPKIVTKWVFITSSCLTWGLNQNLKRSESKWFECWQ